MSEAAINFKASMMALAAAENIDDEESNRRRAATLSPKRAADATLSPSFDPSV